MPRTSRHNRGRKALYKEHGARLLVPDADDSHLRVTIHDEAGLILDRGPRYRWQDGGGMYLDQGRNWSESDARDLAVLCAGQADINRVADVLARKPESIAHRASDLGFRLPTAWASLVRIYKPKETHFQLSYPFIKKARPEHADLLRANSLVPHGFPEHMRADICQSVMLAMFEGTVTLDEIEKNKSKMRWFVGRFYKEQRPWQEVGIEGGEDDRDYLEISASKWSDDRVQDEMNERRRARDSYMPFHPATQEKHVYAREVARAKGFLHRSGEYATAAEAVVAMDGGTATGAEGKWRQTSHAARQAAERHGLLVSPNDIKQIAAACTYETLVFSDHGGTGEVHVVTWRGRKMPVVLSAHDRKVRTFLPREDLDDIRALKSGRITSGEFLKRRRGRRDASRSKTTGDEVAGRRASLPAMQNGAAV